MPAFYERLKNKVHKVDQLLNDLVNRTKIEARAGIAWRRLGEICEQMKWLAVSSLMGAEGTGEQKKTYVLDRIGHLFDTLAPFVYLPIYLEPVRWLLIPIARRVVLAIADGGIEAIYQRLKLETEAADG